MIELKSKFHFFRQSTLTYLDSAATTQVPDVVIRAVEQTLQYRGNPSRIAHAPAERSEQLLSEARKNIAAFISAKPSGIVFTGNTTDSMNLAVDAIAHSFHDGDELVIALSEHHSNMLPYTKLVKRGARIRLVGIRDGIVDPEDIRAALSPRTRLVALAHCSNVLGNINDVASIGRIVKAHDPTIFYCIDGAQAIAHVPVDVTEMQADFYAFSSHKMYGPDGVGVLYVSERITHLLVPSRVGGGTVKNVAVTFGKEEDILSPEYESTIVALEGGTPNTSNIIGLSRAVNFLRTIGFDEIRQHEQLLLEKLLAGLATIDEVTVFGPSDRSRKIGVVSFGVRGCSVKELGDHLGRQRICIRYGSHCAFPLAEQLGQETLRVSFGVYSTEEDVSRLVDEVRYFFEKKRGGIINPNLEPLRNAVFYRNTHVVHSYKSIEEKINQALYMPQETEIIVMGGHFLGIPDVRENRFWPSIRPMIPERLHGLLDEFGMTSFPTFTWKLACRAVASLKQRGYNTRLAIIANDTTGINELRLSPVNATGKTAENYRDELLSTFREDGDLPIHYVEILRENGLSKDDVLSRRGTYSFSESALRSSFKTFIHRNKAFFDGMIHYSAEEDEGIDLSIKLLDHQEISACTFDTFQSKTGGKFCIAELCQFQAELFGKPDTVMFGYTSQKVLEPFSRAHHQVFITFTPAMCDNAVLSAAELYSKLFLQGRGTGSYKFFNIPLGPDAERSLAVGTELKYLSNKDGLEILDVEEEPEFPELWRLNEYKLLYSPRRYVDEMTGIFRKHGITEQSSILDTCVGPGFFSTELLELGYNLTTADKHPRMVEPFRAALRERGIAHEPVISSWLDLKRHFQHASFDLLMNRGNSFIYAAGGWNERETAGREQTLATMRETMQIYFDLLKPGGYLYIDKFRDEEIPDKKVAARISIQATGEQKDIVFSIERKPEERVRIAQMLLRDSVGQERGLPFIAYDLSEDEMEELLTQTGFVLVPIAVESERHFRVWLAQKPSQG